MITFMNIVLIALLMVHITIVLIQHTKIQKLKQSLGYIKRHNNTMRDQMEMHHLETITLTAKRDDLIEELESLEDDFQRLLEITFGESSIPCAVLFDEVDEDGQDKPYYSFEVKKESGIIVSRRNNGKLEKTEAKLGFNLHGIIYTRKDYDSYFPMTTIN